MVVCSERTSFAALRSLAAGCSWGSCTHRHRLQYVMRLGTVQAKAMAHTHISKADSVLYYPW